LGWGQASSHGYLNPGLSNPFPSGVAAQGRIVPLGDLIRVAASPGASGAAIVDQLLVKTGDNVTAGQLLAVLHGHTLLQAQVTAAERDQAAATTALAEAQAAQARASAEIQVQLADLAGRANIADANLHQAVEASHSALEQAQLAATAAHAALDHAKSAQQLGQAASAATVTTADTQLGVIPVRTREAEHKIAAAQFDEAKAAKLNSDAQLAAQVDQAQSQVDLAELHVRQAQAELVVEPAPDEDKLAPVQAEARAAHASLDAERKLLDSTQAESAASVAAAQARVDSANAALAVAHEQLTLSEVHAPAAGTILAVMAHPGEAVGPAGLLQMGDLSQIFVDALVFINDIAGVHVGQKAQVSGSALPDAGLSGVVTSISPIVAGNTLPNPDPTVFSDQTVVLVKVRLDNAAPAANLINGQVTVQFAP
jgi:ABC exporter DevB family membrane fusion protein